MNHISNLFTKIKSSQLRNKTSITYPYSTILEKLLEVLKDHHFIENFEVVTSEKSKEFKVDLRYKNSEPVINNIKFISKPGVRFYANAKNMKPYMNGRGLRIVTTSKGVMSSTDAKKHNVGGEVILELY